MRPAHLPQQRLEQTEQAPVAALRVLSRFMSRGTVSSEVRRKSLRDIKSMVGLTESLGMWKCLLGDFATVLIILINFLTPTPKCLLKGGE